MNIIKSEIDKAWLLAIKNKDPKKNILNLIRAEFQNFVIMHNNEYSTRGPIQDIDAIAVLCKIINKIEETIRFCKSGKRFDLLEVESDNLNFIKSFLFNESVLCNLIADEINTHFFSTTSGPFNAETVAINIGKKYSGYLDLNYLLKLVLARHPT